MRRHIAQVDASALQKLQTMLTHQANLLQVTSLLDISIVRSFCKGACMHLRYVPAEQNGGDHHNIFSRYKCLLGFITGYVHQQGAILCWLCVWISCTDKVMSCTLLDGRHATRLLVLLF